MTNLPPNFDPDDVIDKNGPNSNNLEDGEDLDKQPNTNFLLDDTHKAIPPPPPESDVTYQHGAPTRTGGVSGTIGIDPSSVSRSAANAKAGIDNSPTVSDNRPEKKSDWIGKTPPMPRNVSSQIDVLDHSGGMGGASREDTYGNDQTNP